MLDFYASMIGLACLLFLSALFSATETAFTSLNLIKVSKLSREPFTGWFVKRVSSNKRRLIIAVLIGNNVVNILISVVAAALLLSVLGDSGIAIITGVLAFVLLLFGEIIPKTYAQAHSEKIVRVMAIPIYYLQLALRPLIYFFEIITTAIFFRHRDRVRELFGDSELATALDIGVSQKSFTEEERELIMKFLRIDDTPAKKVMTALSSVFMLESHMKVKDALPIIKKENYSRIPLFDGTRGKITGYVHIKDISGVGREDEDKELYLFSRGLIKVSDVRAVSDVFNELLKFRAHIAVVVRSGEAVGVVTLEDVLEEFIGEIYDETDSSRSQSIKFGSSSRKARLQYVVDASTSLEQVEIMIKQALPKRRDDESLSDMLLFFLKDSKAKKGVRIEGTLFKVLSVENGVITKVKITKNP